MTEHMYAALGVATRLGIVVGIPILLLYAPAVVFGGIGLLILGNLYALIYSSLKNIGKGWEL